MTAATPTFEFVDLFSGLGGFHVALSSLGGEGVFAAEWEPTLNALYKSNCGIQPSTEILHSTEPRVLPAHSLLDRPLAYSMEA